MKAKLDKLRNLSFDELRVRGQQSLSALLERRGLSSLAKLPSDQQFFKLLNIDCQSEEALLAHFRTRSQPHFFPGMENREATISALRPAFPDSEEKIVVTAERIVRGEFDLLGLHGLKFGDPIDWQLEPASGKRTSLSHWSRVNYLDSEVTGDKKIVWELNRHQYFATLGHAYWLTGDQRFAETFATHLQSWMDGNPPKLGINWASSLEVAFRAMSWLTAFYFFKDSRKLSPALFTSALKFLYVHARHLETYLSTYFSPNTHLTGEALGLFYLGTMLPEFKAAQRWQSTGRKILLEQLPLHVRADGVYFEQSSYYHRYTTDFYLHFLILSKLNQLPVPAELEARLKLLLDHLMYITRPDGTTPLFGDDDGGRLIFPAQARANDFRATLATGAALFERGDYKFIAGDVTEEVLWLLGAECFGKFAALSPVAPAATSMAFPDGGYYVMRDSWMGDANYMLIDCGPHGMNNCGHAHADALSFELAARGQALLVDPGTYTYTGSAEMRDWFRSSAAHNTLTVDGESSSVSSGPFSWASIANCQAKSWISRDRFDYFEGKHDGYKRLANPCDHTRAVLFLKGDYWILRDVVETTGRHRFDLWYHLNPGIEPQAETGNCEMEVVDFWGSGLKMAAFGGNSSWDKEESFVSHCYSKRVSAHVLRFSGEASAAGGSEEFLTFLAPHTKSSRRNIREVEAIGGHAFEISDEAFHDILLVKDNARAEMSRLASDFEWTWARYASEDATVPDQLVLIGGHWLEIGGREVLRSRRRIDYLVASRDGDQYQIETDDGVLRLQLPVADLESVYKEVKRKN